MATHVAILMKRYVDLIVQGRKTVESRLTKMRRAPFGAIEPNDRIYFRCSSGPYMATAIAGKVSSHDRLTPAKIATLRRKYNRAVCGDDAYWQWKRDSRYATFIELLDVEPTDTGPQLPPSRGIAWFVCEPEPLPEAWQVTLTEGAVRNCYVRLPVKSPATRPIELLMPDGSVVSTDIRPDGMLRWRGWGGYFRSFGVTAGASVRFERSVPGRYLVTFNGPHQHAETTMTDTGPELSRYISARRLGQLIRQARAEDLGPSARDITTDCLIPADATARAVVRSRQAGVLAGAAILVPIAQCYDSALTVTAALPDGGQLVPGAVVAEISGPLRSILTMERVALNFLTHLSGIATLTAQYVLAVAGTQAGIYDTRKTLPGLRGLEKYAVVCGGGRSHRIGLYDAVLVKDNHIAHIAAADLPAALNDAIAAARGSQPAPKFVEVEVDTLAQLEQVLGCSVDAVLLDNMDAAKMTRAVALRAKLAPNVQLEASGGVALDTVARIARTGVDRISVGALTHSAPALDLGLDILD